MGEHRKTKGKKNVGWEWLLLLLLLIPLGGGMLAILSFNQEGSPLSGMLSQLNPSAKKAMVTSPQVAEIPAQASHALPDNYHEVGSVGEQYSVAIDPETGEMLVTDNEGGVGANTTSVQGSSMTLAQDMLDMEKYAEANKGKLSKEEYNWMKAAAKEGMALAFGAPGADNMQQLQQKSAALQQFSNRLDEAPKLDSQFGQRMQQYQQSLQPDLNFVQENYNRIFPEATSATAPSTTSTTGTRSTSTNTTTNTTLASPTLADANLLIPKTSLLQPSTLTSFSTNTLTSTSGTTTNTATNTTSTSSTSGSTTTTTSKTVSAFDLYAAAGWQLEPATTSTSTTTTTSPTLTTTSTTTLSPSMTSTSTSLGGSTTTTSTSGSVTSTSTVVSPSVTSTSTTTY